MRSASLLYSLSFSLVVGLTVPPDTLAIGKMHKGIMYNLREFKLFVGESPAAMTEVLHSGLYNDEEEEFIPVARHVQHHPSVVGSFSSRDHSASPPPLSLCLI